jgi:hypothetical protein
VLANSVAHYYDEIRHALTVVGPPGPARLPEMDDRWAEFFAATELSFTRLGPLWFLDLSRHSATRTTKTFASALIVARAARLAAGTGKRVLILTPSSANKATALRDAVLRATRLGLAPDHAVHVVCVVPAGARGKLWRSELSTDDDLRAGNPIAVYPGPVPGTVKTLAAEAADALAATLREEYDTILWPTLHLDNYRTADVVRAFAERDMLPPGSGRTHAHAVSSAFGLLGHQLGVRLGAPSAEAPSYLLVQHLDTPDMVVSLCGAPVPGFDRDTTDGLYRQDTDPHFPAVTEDPGERLDSTFYTRQPVTSEAMNAIIGRDGGDGIVVSRWECLRRYDEIRDQLVTADVHLPADPADLREWADVMVMTGVLNAVDRGLLDPAREVVVHGSGSYATGDFDPVPDEHLVSCSSAEELGRLVLDAADACR